MPVLKTNVSGLYFADGQLSFVGARDALIEFGSQLNTRVAITIEFAQVPLVSPYLSQASLVHVCVETEPGVSVTPDGDAVRVCGHPGRHRHVVAQHRNVRPPPRLRRSHPRGILPRPLLPAARVDAASSPDRLSDDTRASTDATARQRRLAPTGTAARRAKQQREPPGGALSLPYFATAKRATRLRA